MLFYIPLSTTSFNDTKNIVDTSMIVDTDVMLYSFMLMSLTMNGFFGSSVLIFLSLILSNILITYYLEIIKKINPWRWIYSTDLIMFP